MPIFQKSVVKKHLKNLDNNKVDRAYIKFQEFYGDKLRLANIMQLKEENYQEGFLREIFVQTLGYTINPDKNYNLTTEYKNQKDARKADGAIISNGKAIGVIELKSTTTKNLESIEKQAFGYKNNQPGCKYVVTSNFQSLRFYVDNATEYEEFNLFYLDKEQFKFLYLLLSKESILNDLPAKLKQETKFHENDISDKLYADYKQFKDKIFASIVENNPQYDKLILFKKSQKLLDRFLFVFFAEDCGLIPPNTISKIVSDWKNLKKLNYYQPLYKLFKDYFSYLDKGKKIEDWGEIPAYNGGLFRADEILDNPDLKIDDVALEKDSLKLSAYDFNTEVDVNILGHIFEHSLNEIEEITAQLQGGKIDKKKSRRKKDGVFYTPKYITKYIVENTVGTLCNEKKDQLQINNILIDEKHRKKDGKITKEGKQLFDTLHNYKNWLLNLKILDPACGSGAFLNQALEFLISEHKQIDDLISELTGESLRLYETDKSILENNIYGVDINEESVEIAKLSLWLRTAQKGRELSDLSGNIKCGNSLIDDPKVAGDKAFDWHKEFPHVFNPKIKEKNYQILPESKPNYAKLIKEKAQKAEELAKEALEISKKVYEYAEKLQVVSEPPVAYGIKKGGFDVVIGNPPYVRLETMKEISASLAKMNYETFQKRGDLYVLFIERGINLLKNAGLISFIMPNKWMQAGYGKPLREFMLKHELRQLIDFGDIQIFEGATTYPCIFISRKAKPKEEISISVLNENNANDFYSNVANTTEYFKTENFSSETWVITSSREQNLLEKLKRKFQTLSEFVGGEANYGIKFGLTEAFLINNQTKKDLIKEDANSIDLIGHILRGRNLTRYGSPNSINLDNIILAHFGSYRFIEQSYPTILKHLLQFETKLKKRGQCNGSKETNEKPFKGQHHWLELDNNPSKKYLELYSKPKIMYQKFQVKPCFIYDEQGLYCNDSMWIIPTENKALLAVLNSKPGWWLITKYCTQIQNGYQLIWKYFGQIPIANPSFELTAKADIMLSLNKELQIKSDKFIKRIKSNLEIQKISKKLQNFYNFEFKTFISELKKQKIKLSFKDQDKWEDYFDSYKQEINELQNKINQTDKEIDKMVYQLYELTDKEIEIVENSVK